MKKISILLMLMALFGPLAMMGQGTLTIGTGTNYSGSGSGTSSATNYGAGSPMGNTYYYYSTAQFIYLASEMEGAKTINSLAFYHNNAGAFNATVKIYLAHTSSSTVSTSSPATSGTLVYTGTNMSVGGSSAGWQTFTLETPFEYNGTDNLMVIVCRTKGTTSPTYQSSLGWQYSTISGSYRFMQRSEDTQNYGVISNTSYSYTASYYRPNIQIGYTTSGSCANGCECFEDCTALTSTSGGSTGSTPDANLPTGWKGYGANYYPFAATFTSYMGSSADGQFMYFKATDSNATYLALPDQYVTQVKFDYAYETDSYGDVLFLEIGYMTDISSSTWYNNTFTSIKTMTNNGATWGSETADFSSVTASTYYVVFKFSQTRGSWYSAAIDNVCLTISVPSIALNPSSATVLTGSTQTLTATTENVHGTPTITYTSSNTNVATVSGSGTTATVTGVAPGTATITATMNGSFTAQSTITVEDPSYCTPSFSDPSDDYIQNFVTTGGTTNISNSSTYVSGGYSDYYSTKSASITAGETLSCTVTPSSTSYKYGHAIWVDWNKDYEFSSTEKVAYSASSATGNWTGTFTIPANTAAGDYRMRVIHQYTSSNTNPATDPCVSTTYGEAEDYKLTVLASGAYTITCATTTGGTISADKTNADENDVVTITATPDTDYLLTALTYTPEGGSAQNIDITNMPYTFTMPAANVTVNATFSLPACPKPTNLTVSNLAASHATVSWDSEAGNYTVKYSTATVTGTTLAPIFEDGFENGIGNWTTYTNGYVSTVTSPTYNITDWHQEDLSNDDESAHTGNCVAMSRSYDGTDRSVDNWLVTPQMTLGNTVKFWVLDDGTYHEYYEVYVSTGSGVVPSSGTGDFQLVEAPALATGSWSERTVDISAYTGQTGYVAIRHHDAEKDWLMVDDFGVYNTINTYSYGGWTTVSPNPTTNSCQLTGLSAETLYEVQVQANCGGTDGSSAWSSAIFTTPDNCGAPQELASSNITATTATLSWADDKDSYNLQYRKVYFYEGFEGETMPTGWTTIDANNDGLTWGVGHATTHSGNNGAYNVSYVYNVTGTTPDDYLVSPLLDLQGTLRVWLSGYPRQSSNYSEHFAIYISTNGNTASDFTTTLVGETTTTSSYVEYTASLSQYEGQQGYIAIRHFNCTDQYYLYVDDFGLYGTENWVALNPNPTTETANLTGLTPIIENDYHLLPTTYEWQVQGVNCDGNGGTTEWSDVATFTTGEGYVKNIIGYGDPSNAGGYYLIASPIGNVAPTAVTNMINLDDQGQDTQTGYDLFYFDQSQDMEWVTYKNQQGASNHSFNLVAGKGYLYARKLTADLVFTGPAYSTQNGTQDVTLAYSATSELGNNADLPGWNLVGNPFGVTAYVDRGEYYTMNSAGSEFVPVTVNSGNFSVEPMEGIFVIAEPNGETMTFSTTEPQPNDDKGFALNLSQDRGVIDRAIVRFGQGRQLPKFQLNPNHTKVYIPVDGKDYAVVRSEEMGAMPVNFKAENNGTYTLGLSTENAVGFAYLHLIDNMTGKDVDLLQTPSYTFEAKTTDYESRFKLVYATGNNSTSDNFAFFSNGSFVINNDGEATLQVIDIMGRILKSENINGCANMNVNAAPGVYMLRLVNGDNVKVQKVVVK